ncbi:Hypothetical predicted protein [Cloeon dipterum]|uniref:Uncharacterized protein n=1 Tax=Cloeon dipterum TaxID=197152 RepID=A0A8S1C8S1_9INSE|nr:Hypothetical predicted protein [Cloeon dipterum]
MQRDEETEAELISSLRNERRRVAAPPSLFDKCLDYVFNNVEELLRSDLIKPSDFSKESVSQRAMDESRRRSSSIFTSAEEAEKEYQEYLRSSMVRRLILYNKECQLRHLNLFDISVLGDDEPEWYLEEALKNCRRLERITAPCPLNYSASKSITLDFATRIVQSFPALRILDLTGFYITNMAMKLISEKLPDLTKINLSFFGDGRKFTSDPGTSYLVNLKNLTDIEISVKNFLASYAFYYHLLLVISGAMPNVKNFHINRHDSDSICNSFVLTSYAMMMSIVLPDKRMTLRQVEVMKPLKVAWSSNLFVDSCLAINPCAVCTDSQLMKLCKVPCGVQELILIDCSRPEVIYKLLRQLGPRLKRLKLEYFYEDELLESGKRLKLSKVMSLCPELEHFRTNDLIPLVASSKYKLTPKHFKKVKSFELSGECTNLEIERLKLFSDIFQMVLLGSPDYKVLEVQNVYLLKAIARFLSENPACLTQVEVFNAVAYQTNVDLVCDIGRSLMIRSAHLRRIEIHGFQRYDS